MLTPSVKISFGFSLIEIVIALGIVSFAIVGIMGLFPAAMRSAQESQRETKAALIARQIFSDLKTFGGTNAFVADTTNVLDAGLKINLAANGTYSVDYNGEGVPTSSPDSASFAATITVVANDPVAGVARVQASLRPKKASASEPAYNFVTFLFQN